MDDAYFYLVIARNFPALGHMTFDRQMPTNGVQPLWQVLLIGYEYLMPGHALLAWSLGTAWALFALFSGLVAHFARARLRLSLGPFAAFCALVPLNPQFQRAAIQGLETSLFLALLVVWAFALAKYRKPSNSCHTWQPYVRAIALALWSTLLFLLAQHNRGRWCSPGIAVCAAIVVAAQPVAAPPVSTSWNLRIDMAHALSQLPESAKIAAFWPGALSYFSQRSVFPLDGIVGSNRHFEEVVKPGKELECARTSGIEYVVASLAPPELVASDKPPQLRTWPELAALRLWQACRYLQGVVLERSDGTGHWRVYSLSAEVSGWLECLGRARTSRESS